MYAPYPKTPVRLIPIDSFSISAAASYTSPTWTAGTYSKIMLEFVGSTSAFSYYQFQANADSAAVYTDIGTNVNTTSSVDSAFKGTNGFARVGVCIGAGNENVCIVDFYPLTTGRTRPGTFRSMSDNNSGTGTSSMQRQGGFAYNDTATSITSITFSVAAATMTGLIIVTGIPA